MVFVGAKLAYCAARRKNALGRQTSAVTSRRVVLYFCTSKAADAVSASFPCAFIVPDENRAVCGKEWLLKQSGGRSRFLSRSIISR